MPSSWAVHLSDITRESELIGPTSNEAQRVQQRPEVDEPTQR